MWIKNKETYINVDNVFKFQRDGNTIAMYRSDGVRESLVFDSVELREYVFLHLVIDVRSEDRDLFDIDQLKENFANQAVTTATKTIGNGVDKG